MNAHPKPQATVTSYSTDTSVKPPEQRKSNKAAGEALKATARQMLNNNPTDFQRMMNGSSHEIVKQTNANSDIYHFVAGGGKTLKNSVFNHWMQAYGVSVLYEAKAAVAELSRARAEGTPEEAKSGPPPLKCKTPGTTPPTHSTLEIEPRDLFAPMAEEFDDILNPKTDAGVINSKQGPIQVQATPARGTAGAVGQSRRERIHDRLVGIAEGGLRVQRELTMSARKANVESKAADNKAEEEAFVANGKLFDLVGFLGKDLTRDP